MEDISSDAFILRKIKEDNKVIVGRFTTNGIDYVVVKLENATHVMPETDWRKTYGKLHPERWKKR